MLRQMEYIVISPAETFGGRDDLDRATYGRYDIAALLQVDGVVLLPGWETSEGAQTEVAIAKWLGLHFFKWAPPTLIYYYDPPNPAATAAKDAIDAIDLSWFFDRPTLLA